MNIIWHDSPESAHEAMWRPVAKSEGMTYAELVDCEIVAQDESGNEFTVTHAQEIEGMREQKTWGWIDHNTNTIHAWAHADAEPALIIHMLAHEIGHATGMQAEDPLEEEMRAEQFGQAARLAYQLMIDRNVSR